MLFQFCQEKDLFFRVKSCINYIRKDFAILDGKGWQKYRITKDRNTGADQMELSVLL